MAKCIDSRKNNYNNYLKYCKGINVYGKNILVKFLKWFYKGGDKNYLDYLNSEYSLRDIDRLFDASLADYLKCKTPEEFDMTLIHAVFLLTCNLHEIEDFIDDSGCGFLERGVENLLSEVSKVGRMKASLSDSELESKLYDLRILYEGLIKTGGALSGINTEEAQELFDTTCFGVMCQNSYILKFNPSFAKEKKALYNEDLVMKIEKIEQKYEKTSSQNKPLPECYIEIVKEMRRKKKVEGVKPNDEYNGLKTNGKDDGLKTNGENDGLKTNGENDGLKTNGEDDGLKMNSEDDGLKTSSDSKIQVDKASSKDSLSSKNLDKSTNVEKQTSSKKSNMTEKKFSSPNSKIQSAVVQAENTNIFCSRQDTCIDSNIVDNLKLSFYKSSDESSTAQPAPTSYSGIFREALYSFYFENEKVRPCPGIPNSLLYSDLLKQHQKYSRKPGQQVKLKDLLTIEGMNHEVAEIIIVSGEAGIGKSFLLKFIREKWMWDPEVFDEKLCHYSLFHTDLKNNDYSNFNDLTSSLLNFEMMDEEEIREPFSGMHVLLTLDGYDESAEKSCQLVKEVLQMIDNNFFLKMIITSRPQYVDCIYKQIPKSRRKHVTHLSLNSIPSTLHAGFVSQFIDSWDDCILRDKSIREVVKEGLISHLPEIYLTLGEDLCNPLMLKIITAMWIEKKGIM